MVVVLRLASSRRWLFGGVLWGLVAVPFAPQGGHLFPPREGVSLCMLMTLPWWPMYCGERRALGDVLVHLCSLMALDASPNC